MMKWNRDFIYHDHVNSLYTHFNLQTKWSAKIDFIIKGNKNVMLKSGFI